MAQAAEHGGAAQPALLLTFDDAQAAVQATRSPPGRGKANEIPKAHLQIQHLVLLCDSMSRAMREVVAIPTRSRARILDTQKRMSPK